MQLTIEPLLYLVAFGSGFSHVVKSINGTSMMDYYYPARLCNTAMVVAFFEGTYPTLAKITYQNTYLSMSLGTLKNNEIIIGELLWCTLKGFLAAIFTMIVSSMFGVGSVNIIYIIPVVLVLCLTFAALAMTITSHIQKYAAFSYISSVLILPISLFSGTFIPIAGFPKYVQFISGLLPSTHAIILSRTIYAGNFSEKDYGHVLICLFYLFLTILCCYFFFKKRLEDN